MWLAQRSHDLEAAGISSPRSSAGASDVTAPYPTVRAAALAVLNDPDAKVNWFVGSFLGQCCCARRPLSEKQRDWLTLILERAGHPPLAGEAQ